MTVDGHDALTTDELVAMVRETTQAMLETAHRLQLLTSVLRQRLLESRGSSSGPANGE